jgi:hypothetical protein
VLLEPNILEATISAVELGLDIGPGDPPLGGCSADNLAQLRGIVRKRTEIPFSIEQFAVYGPSNKRPSPS